MKNKEKTFISGIIIGCLITLLTSYPVSLIQNYVKDKNERKYLANILLLEICMNIRTLKAIHKNTKFLFDAVRMENLSLPTEIPFENFETVWYKSSLNKLGMFDLETVVHIVNFYSSLKNIEFNFEKKIYFKEERFSKAKENFRERLEEILEKGKIAKSALERVIGRKVICDKKEGVSNFS